jgi:hypothetical protein
MRERSPGGTDIPWVPNIATALKIEAMGELGSYQKVLTLTNDAMARVTARHLNMHISELLRIRAGIYERSGQAKLATDDYQAAIDIGNNFSLLSTIGIRRSSCATNPATGATRELPRCCGGTSYDLSDLIEGSPEP